MSDLDASGGALLIDGKESFMYFCFENFCCTAVYDKGKWWGIHVTVNMEVDMYK